MPLQHFKTDGGELAVEVEGNGPLIICCPGMGDTRDAYAHLTSRLLNQGYTVACMDPRGHGDSSVGFQRYGDEATADDFIFLAEKLGRGKPVVLAGASFAAGAATIAAGRRSELIAGLVLLGPFLRIPNIIGLYITSILFARPWGPAMWQWYAASLWPGLGQHGAKTRAASSTASLKRPGRWPAFQATVSGADHRTVTPWLANAAKIPAIVVMGDKDPDWKDPIAEAKWVASNFRDVQSLIVEGAGHAPMLECPEIVGKHVLQFLDSLKSKLSS